MQSHKLTLSTMNQQIEHSACMLLA